MNGIKLNSAQILTIELEGKRLRLVIYKNGVEQVCRKEYLSKLLRFVDGEDQRIFKGRLQLIKTGKGIGVEVKNEVIGNIATNMSLELLKNATASIPSQT